MCIAQALQGQGKPWRASKLADGEGASLPSARSPAPPTADAAARANDACSGMCQGLGLEAVGVTHVTGYRRNRHPSHKGGHCANCRRR